MEGLQPSKPVTIVVRHVVPLTPSQAIEHLRALGFEGDLEERLRSMAAQGDIEVSYSAIRIKQSGQINPAFWQTSVDREFDWSTSSFKAVVEEAPKIEGRPWNVTYEGVRFVFDNVRGEIPEVDDAAPRPRGRPRNEARWEQVTAALLILGAAGRLNPKDANFIRTRTDLVSEIQRSSVWKGSKYDPPSSKILQPVVDRLCELGHLSIS